jgi:hypothetical protein
VPEKAPLVRTEVLSFCPASREFVRISDLACFLANIYLLVYLDRQDWSKIAADLRNAGKRSIKQ